MEDIKLLDKPTNNTTNKSTIIDRVKLYKKEKPRKFWVILSIIIVIIIVIIVGIILLIGHLEGGWFKSEPTPPKKDPTPPTPPTPPQNVPIKLISSETVKILTPNNKYLSGIAFENSLTAYVKYAADEFSIWKIDIYEEIKDGQQIRTCTIQNTQGLYLSNTRIPDYPQHITLDNVKTYWTIAENKFLSENNFHLKLGADYLTVCETCIRTVPDSCYLQERGYTLTTSWKLEPVV